MAADSKRGDDMPDLSAARLIAEARSLRVKPVDRRYAPTVPPVNREIRRGEILDNYDNWGREHIVKGRVLLRGSGEATVRVPFYRYYLEQPNYNFGSVLTEEGAALVSPGSFPTLNAEVAGWEYHRPDLELFGINMRQYWTAAIVIIVATGPDAMDRWFDYTFSGKSIMGPAGSDDLNLILPQSGDLETIV